MPAKREADGLTAFEWLVKAIAGSTAGAISTTLCSPLDVAKTRAQVQSVVGGGTAHKYDGVLRALRTIYREEGFRGWYHGLTPTICSVAIFWSCYFPCYEHAKTLLADATGSTLDSPRVHLAAAGSAGLVTDVITNPLWVVRTRLTTQALVDRPGQLHYVSMTHAFRTIAREEGLLAFFSGLRASILGLSHIMIQFPLYERLKVELSRAAAASPVGDTSPLVLSPPPAVSMPDIIAASAISKLVASSLTYPHEVIRARLQFDTGQQLYSSTIDAIRKTVAADGFAGLWQGYSLNIVRTIPQCIITFTVYEAVSNSVSARLAERARADDTLGRTLSVMAHPPVDDAPCLDGPETPGSRKPMARRDTRSEPVLKLTRSESR